MNRKKFHVTSNIFSICLFIHMCDYKTKSHDLKYFVNKIKMKTWKRFWLMLVSIRTNAFKGNYMHELNEIVLSFIIHIHFAFIYPRERYMSKIIREFVVARRRKSGKQFFYFILFADTKKNIKTHFSSYCLQRKHNK